MPLPKRTAWPSCVAQRRHAGPAGQPHHARAPASSVYSAGLGRHVSSFPTDNWHESYPNNRTQKFGFCYNKLAPTLQRGFKTMPRASLPHTSTPWTANHHREGHRERAAREKFGQCETEVVTEDTSPAPSEPRGAAVEEHRGRGKVFLPSS